MNRFVLAFIACLWLPSALANDLYHASIPLDNGAQTSQQAAKKQGLSAVLTKVSGQRNLSDNPAVKQALQEVDSLITQLGYGEHEQGADGATQRTLEVGFDSQQVREILRQAGLPLWGSPRPSVLVWLVDDRGLERQIIWEQSERPVIDELRQAAALRGLPVLIPVGDFDDLMAISSSDLWGGFIQPVEQASERYQPDGIVIAKLTDQGIRWQLFPEANQMQTNQTRGQASDASAMIHSLADYYAQQTGVILDQDEDSASVVIAIGGIESGDDYVALEKTLANLNAVQSVHLRKLNDHTLVFDAQLAASQQALIKELTANREVRLMTMQEQEAYTARTSPTASESANTAQPAVELEQGDQAVEQGESDLVPEPQPSAEKRLWFVWQP
ncbi:DUF2066 domain-containing protein [Salinivibrio kushneri]|uniref:DUF2066 domain-containing protein n=1 Tax=Salinivibrio kushneri TaxID=1908198 RepID=UPI00098652B6|nr:DUF2066 domain-containing protein [Salinivibrio kushneri]OOE48323.1 hypothetical protein BZG10_11835 [Salinivibrio kushneri]OOE53627.1 hypothetical protein BZG11_01835 [Salinivibrio kushneri]OOE63337.1 hypothetical protein BZG18_01350 [Salinivibrio kushneri]